jgi:DNA-binding protein HU-beta
MSPMILRQASRRHGRNRRWHRDIGDLPASKPLSFGFRIISLIASAFPRSFGGLFNMAAKASRPVTLKHLAATLAEEHQLTKKASEAMLGDLVGLITKHLKKGERIRISGLGILQVRKRAARMGRNPATGEAIKIKASKKVAFRASKELKMAV